MVRADIPRARAAIMQSCATPSTVGTLLERLVSLRSRTKSGRLCVAGANWDPGPDPGQPPGVAPCAPLVARAGGGIGAPLKSLHMMHQQEYGMRPKPELYSSHYAEWFKDP